MTPQEKQLLQGLRENVDSLDDFASFFEDNADAKGITSKGTRIAPVKGNPIFSAQFDLQIITKYFTQAAGVYTAVLPAAINAALQTALAAFFFGNSDFGGGYSRMRTAFPVSGGWVYNDAFVYGVDLPRCLYSNLDATVLAQFRLGDLVIPFTSGALNTLGVVIIRCRQTQYGALLKATQSDRFLISGLRYNIADPLVLNQFANDIGIYKASLFGKFDSDSLSPNSYKQPEQNQAGIIDIPLKKGVTKEISLGTYINYNATDITWSIFVQTVQKIG